MPRHRQGNIPKHRARPPQASGRRVPLHAADPRPADARATDARPTEARPIEGRATDARATDARGRHAAWHAAPDDDPPGVPAGPPAPGSPTLPFRIPLPSRRGRAGRLPPPGASQPRRVRGLLVTPWFAAGAGFVVAAAMALNSGPRTFLTYRPNATKCSGCSSAPGSLATSRPGIQIRSGQADGTGRPGGPVGPAVTVQRGPADHGIFYVTFIVPAGQAHNGWRLRFELPGRSVNQVWNALWQPDATGDGGVASIPAEAGSTVGRTFEVSAVGAWTRPGGCVLNGHACQFVMAP
jgi:hypothetical protein